jgi:hypothetical protein
MAEYILTFSIVEGSFCCKPVLVIPVYLYYADLRLDLTQECRGGGNSQIGRKDL